MKEAFRSACNDRSIIMRVFIAVMLIFVFHCLYNISHRDLGYPYNTFLFNSKDRFADHTKAILSFPVRESVDPSNWPKLFKSYYYSNNYKGVEGLATGEMTNVAGLPFRTFVALIWGQILKVIGPVAEFLLAGAVYIGLAIMVAMSVTRVLHQRLAVFGLLTLSYPALMVLDRGNFDAGFAGICIIMFFVQLARGKDVLSLIALALAINMRPNLAVLVIMVGGFYWAEKLRMVKYGILLGLATIGIFCASLLGANLIYPDYTLDNFLKGVAIYNQLYGLDNAGLAYGSSLVGGFKMLGYMPNGIYAANYGALASLLALTWLAAMMRKVTFTECAYLSIIYALLFSHILADYHLIIFVVPVLLAAATNNRLTDKGNWLLVLVTILLLAPKNTGFIEGNISYQVIINPALMLAAIAIILYNVGRRVAFKENVAPLP